MDTKKENDLKVFGYGLALFIPFFIMFHSREHGLSLWGFVVTIVTILFVLSKSTTWPWLYLGTLFVTVGLIFILPVKNHLGVLSVIFLLIAAGIFVQTVRNVQSLEFLYRHWMKVGHFVGSMITGILLTVMFYCVFGVVGIVLRLMRKDLLDRAWQLEAKSYWQKPQHSFDKNHYKRQF